MDDAPDRTLGKPRIDAKTLADLVEIMSRNGRRAVVKLDDRRIDDLSTLTNANVGSAHEIDVSSFWVNPERPHHGRRHFVYFLSGPTGAQYFGDSVSPEVTAVCHDLDVYFGRQGQIAAAPAAAASTAGPPAGLPGWWPKGWVFETPERFAAVLGGAVLLIALFAFLLGRWSVSEPEPKLIYRMLPPPEVPDDAKPATTLPS